MQNDLAVRSLNGKKDALRLAKFNGLIHGKEVETLKMKNRLLRPFFQRSILIYTRSITDEEYDV